MTSELDYSRQVLDAIHQSSLEVLPEELDEKRRNNAAKAMVAILLGRLAIRNGTPEHLKHTRYQWQSGVISIRNARVGDHHWTSIGEATLTELEEVANTQPVLHLLTYFAVDEKQLHVWAVPETVARESLLSLPPGNKTGQRTVEVYPGVNRFHKVEDSPDLAPFYCRSQLSDAESDRLAEAIKLDSAAKEQQVTIDASPAADDTDDAPDVVGVRLHEFDRGFRNRTASAHERCAVAY